jgi:hypothetical protein
MAYPRAFPGNQYADIMMKMGGEEIMPSLGLTKQHVKLLEDWVRRSSPPHIAVFDWDRTLTVVEGLVIPGNREWNDLNRKWPWSITDTMEYLFGGTARLQMLQDMFKWLHNQGVDVFIVTRNNSAVGAKMAFYDLIRHMDPVFSFDHLIYTSGDAKKSEALRNNREYRIIMTPIRYRVGQYLRGGKRNRTRSRGRSQRRKKHLKTRRG